MTLEIDWICLECGQVCMMTIIDDKCRRCGWERPPRKTVKEKGPGAQN